MDFILRLKAWQLFLIFVVPTFIFQPFLNDLLLFALGLITWAFIFFWIYSIGVKMNALVPIEFRPRISRFKTYYLVSAVLQVILLIWSFFIKDPLASTTYEIVLQCLLIAVGLYFALSIFMSAARTLKMAILQHHVDKSDAMLEFFCIWMFPLGVWVIQPAVNKVLREHSDKPGIEKIQ